MSDLVSNAQWAVEKLECQDWEVGPFDGHCLRLTCKRCLLDRAVKALAASQAELAAMRARAEAAERLTEAATLVKRRWDQLTDCVNEFEPEDMGACGETRDLLDDAILKVIAALAAAPPAPAADPGCRCGRRLLFPGEADPWCEGCNMSASTCDCVPAADSRADAAPADGTGGPAR